MNDNSRGFSGATLVAAWCFALLTLFACAANAATVTFADLNSTVQQTSFNVTRGQTFAVDVIGKGFDALLGGTFSIQYDEAKLTINSVIVDPRWDESPDGGSDTGANLWGVVGFDVFDNLPGSGDFRLATISFTARDAFGGAALKVVNSQFFAENPDSTAQNPLDPVAVTPTLTDAMVSVVPLPGAAWMMLTAFGAAACRAGRRGGQRGRA